MTEATAPAPAPAPGAVAPAWQGPATRLLDALSRPATAAWIAALVAVAVYAHAALNGFAYDDVQIIQQNDALHTWSGIVQAWAHPYWPGHYAANVGVWRPLVSTWWGLQWLAWGDRPWLFHVVAVLVHAVATYLVVRCLALLLPARAAGIGGLLFALHPVHVEAVANVVSNADALAAVWVMAAVLVHLRGGEDYGWPRSLVLALLYLAGLLTKEGAVVLPGLLVLLDGARRDIRLGELGAWLARRWRPYGTLTLTLALYLLVRVSVLGGVAPPQVPAALFDEVPRIQAVAAIWPQYVRLMAVPWDLAGDYGGIVKVPLGWTASNVTGVAVALLLLGLALWAWRTGPALSPMRSSRRVLGLAVVWFVLAVLPVANVFFPSPVMVAERNLYLPSLAAAAAGGWLLHVLLVRRWRAGVLALAGVTLFFTARTVTRVPVWTSSDAVFEDLLEHHPEAWRSWAHLGNELFDAGRMKEAREAYGVMLQLSGSGYAMASDVAMHLSSMDPASQRAAEFLLERAWREQPGYYTAPGYLAVHYLNHGRYEKGLPPARAAVLLAPENPDMQRVLASLLSGAGRPAEAIPHRLKALAEGGDGWRSRVWLAQDYAAVGDTAAARASLAAAEARAGDDASRAEVMRAGRELLGGDPPPAGRDRL